MIQILPPKNRGFAQQFKQNFPSMFRAAFADSMKREGAIQQQQKLKELEANRKEPFYEKFEARFGRENADLFKGLETGGQTELLKYIIDSEQRGLSLNDKAGIKDDLPSYDQPSEDEELDVDVGLTPKERIGRQEDRYKINLPLQQENQKKLESLRSDEDLIGILDDLDKSGKLPSFMGRLNVNPQTGKILLPSAASPEAQQYVKTIQAFTTKAKDTYGGRVTNFELDQFLQGLPTLANSAEGRDVILKQMQYFNQKAKIYQEELDSYIDSKGGIRNVDFDQAERVARKRADAKTKDLKKQYDASRKMGDKIIGNRVAKLKSKIPPGSVLVQKDGQYGYMTKKQFQEAQKDGQGYEEVE